MMKSPEKGTSGGGGPSSAPVARRRLVAGRELHGEAVETQRDVEENLRRNRDHGNGASDRNAHGKNGNRENVLQRAADDELRVGLAFAAPDVPFRNAVAIVGGRLARRA